MKQHIVCHTISAYHLSQCNFAKNLVKYELLQVSECE